MRDTAQSVATTGYCQGGFPHRVDFFFYYKNGSFSDTLFQIVVSNLIQIVKMGNGNLGSNWRGKNK